MPQTDKFITTKREYNGKCVPCEIDEIPRQLALATNDVVKAIRERVDQGKQPIPRNPTHPLVRVLVLVFHLHDTNGDRAYMEGVFETYGLPHKSILPQFRMPTGN